MIETIASRIPGGYSVGEGVPAPPRILLEPHHTTHDLAQALLTHYNSEADPQEVMGEDPIPLVPGGKPALVRGMGVRSELLRKVEDRVDTFLNKK